MNEQSEKKVLPSLGTRPATHVYVTCQNKASIHTKDEFKTGKKINIDRYKAVVMKITREEKSVYYAGCNFYEMEFKIITK